MCEEFIQERLFQWVKFSLNFNLIDSDFEEFAFIVLQLSIHITTQNWSFYTQQNLPFGSLSLISNPCKLVAL